LSQLALSVAFVTSSAKAGPVKVSAKANANIDTSVFMDVTPYVVAGATKELRPRPNVPGCRDSRAPPESAKQRIGHICRDDGRGGVLSWRTFADPRPVVGDDVEAVRERLGDGVPVCTRFASAGLQDDDGRGQAEADASWLAFGEPNGGFRSKTETFG
jgi:hypothetical protein